MDRPEEPIGDALDPVSGVHWTMLSNISLTADHAVSTQMGAFTANSLPKAAKKGAAQIPNAGGKATRKKGRPATVGNKGNSRLVATHEYVIVTSCVAT